MAIHSTGRSTYFQVDEIPPDFIEYLHSGVHTGRGTGHQIATTNMIIRGLVQRPKIVDLVEREQLCYFAGAKLGRRERNVDLVFGRPSGGARFDDTVGMLLGMPQSARVSGEYKTIMTELGKNAGNRKDDFIRHAQASRGNSTNAYSFAVCVVNASDTYFSYTAREQDQFRDQRDGKLKAARAIEVLSDSLNHGVDLLWTPVVVANNHPDPDQRIAHWLKGYPQPPDGSNLAWGHFMDELADAIVDRMG